MALFGAFIYLRYATRIYSAGGSMLIKNDQGKSTDRADDILFGPSRVQSIQNEIEVLKSQPLMQRVVKKLDLCFSYTAKGKIKDLNVYKSSPFIAQAFEITDSSRGFSFNIKFTGPDQFKINNEGSFHFNELFKNQYGVFRLVNRAVPVTGSEFTLSWQPVESAAGHFIESMSVQPKSAGTNIITLSMQTTNPRLSADVVNGLMKEYDSITIEQNNLMTDQILGFIDGRLNILNRELDSAQQNLLLYQQRYNLIDVDLQSADYFARISEADRAIVQQQMKLGDADMVEGYLRDKKNRFNRMVVPTSLSVEDRVLGELVDNYNKAQLERQSLLSGNVPAENPLMKESEEQIEKLRESILENIRNVKQSYNSIIGQLRRESSAGRSDAQALPFKVKEYVELRRQVDIKLELVKTLQGKREEAAISRASTISNSKIIEMARESDVPVRPDKKLIQILAVFIGLGIPLLIIFIREILNDKITARTDIEKLTQAPILGEVGHSYNDKVLVVSKTSRSMVAEQFRIIRSNLQYVLNKAERPVIMVTSSFSGEGKSFVSTNVGAVIALTNKKTVILEFDIRKPKVLSGLNMGKKPGISNFLVGKAELKDLIIPVPDAENLYVLPCGPIPPNPSELLLDERVTELFDYLKANFDVVIIDTAPIGMVSDAMTLGKFADCTLYLVRQEHTYKKQIVLIDDYYRENKLPKLSIIVNDVKMKPGYGYYGSGRYGYGYGYGNSYYEEEAVPPTFWERLLGLLDVKKWFKRKGKK
ncbi:polysaccharide biosynthesis tyrosine autokinase [Nostoc ellipsosporum NOK]|nr:polysaccharide biosynthesis tyrosine autokinase [Nostoc ellipsosporum NOK]